MQRLQRERRVAHPGVPVVPVAFAARRLGQRGRERRHRRAGRHIREPLDRQRRALDRLPPPMIGDPRPTQPVPPEHRGAGNAVVRLIEVFRCRETLAPRERAVQPLAGAQHVTGSHPVAFDAQVHVRAEPDREVGTFRIGGVEGPIQQGPVGRCPAVVEDRLADQFHLDPAVDALGRAHQHVTGIVVRRRARVRGDRVGPERRPHDQGIADDDPTRRRFPRGLEHVRARFVAVGARDVDAERAKAKRARPTIEQTREHARRVELGHAQPVHAAVGSDERTRVAVGKEGVLRDRRERRQHRRALTL